VALAVLPEPQAAAYAALGTILTMILGDKYFFLSKLASDRILNSALSAYRIDIIRLSTDKTLDLKMKIIL
jgi:hypothetical protein